MKTASLILAVCLASAFRARAGDGNKSPINVGPNVQVSAPLSEWPHFEITACVNPNLPSHTLVGSMFQRANRISVAVYRSIDNGKTWSLAFTTDSDIGLAADPTCAFDGRGNAYFVVGGKDQMWNPTEHRLLVYRSSDDGLTWSAPLRLPFMDREWITVMNSSENRRSILIHGMVGNQQLGVTRTTSAMASISSFLTTLAGTASLDGEHF